MADGARRAILVWHKSDGSTVDFALATRVIVGRGFEASVRVDEPLVSRAHAELVRRGSHYVVRDLGSTNLTRVNGDIVSERQLDDGDELRFGRARCIFHWAEPAQTDPQSEPNDE